MGGLFTHCLCATLEQAYDTTRGRSSLRTLEQLTLGLADLMASRLAGSTLMQAPVLRAPGSCSGGGAGAAQAKQVIEACLFGSEG
jgi:hypothetical protein